ncbi:SMI1/KNR4 family protein [Stackebrandtia albiflava]|uniref:SMI1/KNR4 family protein n=1 Tax=Stackebrandtia albiflava TaxID=406432 RepID=UPI0013155E36|nr:SMI1/KNR4 family protein [Stackebrandtia albiflava]
MRDEQECERLLIERVAATGAHLVHAIARPGSVAVRSYDENGRGMGSPRIFGLVRAMREASSDGRRHLVVEIRRRADGYTVSRSTELESLSPVRLVLDPDYRYPGHPLPGMPRPAGIDVTDRPTDPVVLAETTALVEEFVALYTSIKGRAPDFGRGRTEREIVAAETELGFRLPEEVRALYRVVECDPEEYGLLGAQRLLPLTAVVEWYHEGGPGVAVGEDGMFPTCAVVFEASPAGHVRRLSRSDWWVTITSDPGCNYGAIDLDPGPRGRRGQLFEFGRDFHGPVGYIAESVTVVLRQVVEALRTGAYEDPDSEDPYLEFDDGLGRSAETDHHRSVRMGGRGVDDVVADLVDPSEVQAVYLNDGDVIGLGGLAPLPLLREISVNRANHVTTTLSHDQPVEALSIDARTVDLEGLAGHPTLWSLKLTGVEEAVSVESLAAVPQLAELDLSGVEVRDVERLGEPMFSGLRVLTLSAEQWGRLREVNGVPTGLAAASMTGVNALDDAVAWAGGLRGRAGGGVGPRHGVGHDGDDVPGGPL